MPNHITNIIKANSEVIAALRSDKAAVDFNTMIPMPQSLHDIIISNGDDNLVKLLNGKLSINPPHDDLLANMKLSNVLLGFQDGGMTKWDNERFENFIVMLRNYREHGVVSWYDFGCDKWGTKWNAYSIVEADGNSIQFETAWAAPHPVIEALVAKFPEVCIEHLWADEDIGSNLGHRRYCNGATDLPIADPVDFALTVRGNDREYYRSNPETGKWEYYEQPEALSPLPENDTPSTPADQ